VLFVGFTLVRTARYGTAQPAVEPAPPIPIPTGAVERLAGSLRFPTISHEAPAAFDAEAFRALHAYFPRRSKMNPPAARKRTHLFFHPLSFPSLLLAVVPLNLFHKFFVAI
jgi:hypothetical protein